MTDIERLRTAYKPIDKVRCSRRFRQQIYSSRHPGRRIHRVYRCCVCHEEGPTEFHHVDYRRPFFGSWLCVGCHRKVDAETLELKERHMFNYESLVRTHKGRWRKGEVVSYKPTGTTPF